MKIELSDKEAEFLMRALCNNYAEDDQDFDQNDICDRGICNQLIGKFIYRNNLYDLYHQIMNEKYSAKDPINKYLFLGAGWHSLVDKNKLYKRLEYAINHLGGKQQNGGMGTEFDEESDKQDKQALKEVMLDVLTAFGLTMDDLK